MTVVVHTLCFYGEDDALICEIPVTEDQAKLLGAGDDDVVHVHSFLQRWAKPSMWNRKARGQVILHP